MILNIIPIKKEDLSISKKGKKFLIYCSWLIKFSYLIASNFPARTSMAVNDRIRRNTTVYMWSYYDPISLCRKRRHTAIYREKNGRLWSFVTVYGARYSRAGLYCPLLLNYKKRKLKMNTNWIRLHRDEFWKFRHQSNEQFQDLNWVWNNLFWRNPLDLDKNWRWRFSII